VKPPYASLPTLSTAPSFTTEHGGAGLPVSVRTRALFEPVQVLVEDDPVLALPVAVHDVPVAVKGEDEVETPAGEDPVFARATNEGVVAVVALEAVGAIPACWSAALLPISVSPVRSPRGCPAPCRRRR
jgi:adenine/guanine phosphoribosyltransferase-like PRPP-binding protein